MATIAQRLREHGLGATAAEDISQGQPGTRATGTFDSTKDGAKERYGFDLAQKHPLKDNWAGGHGGGVVNQVTPEVAMKALGADTADPAHDLADLQYVDGAVALVVHLAGIKPGEPGTAQPPFTGQPSGPVPFDTGGSRPATKADIDALTDALLASLERWWTMKRQSVGGTDEGKALSALKSIKSAGHDFEKGLGDRPAHETRTFLATIGSFIAEGGA